jgi:hypothetical protein
MKRYFEIYLHGSPEQAGLLAEELNKHSVYDKKIFSSEAVQ